MHHLFTFIWIITLDESHDKSFMFLFAKISAINIQWVVLFYAYLRCSAICLATNSSTLRSWKQISILHKTYCSCKRKKLAMFFLYNLYKHLLIIEKLFVFICTARTLQSSLDLHGHVNKDIVPPLQAYFVQITVSRETILGCCRETSE